MPGTVLRLPPAPRAWARFAPAVIAASFVATAAAAPIKDADAEKALKQAMDVDYFKTDFKKAEEKLRAAIDGCATTCSAGVKAKLYVALGTVLAAKKELGDASDAFVEALKLDPKVAPDPDLTSAEVSFAFEKAKTTLKIGAPAAKGPAATHTAPAAQRVHTPVPLYVELAAESAGETRKVTGSYAGPGTDTFEPLTFRKIGERGFGAEVPCEDVLKEGELRYLITVLGEGSEVVATFGSKDEPLRVPLKPTISSEAPHWPGFSAPEQCKSSKGEPAQCLDDRQCNSGLVCRTGQCVADEAATTTPESPLLKNWITLSFGLDLPLYSGENVCTRNGQEQDSYVCFREDGSRYTGNPVPDTGNNVNFGFVLATMRVALQYERLVWNNFTAGLRLGFAFNGASGQNVNFLPVHVEGRIGYSIGADVFAGKGLRPFVFVSGGLAQVDARVKVEILENGKAEKLDAYKQAGTGFATLGAGLVYMPIKHVGFHVALRGGVTFPVLAGLLSPEAGVTAGF